MFKKLFSKKTISTIGLFLGMNKLALCRLENGRVHLLAQAEITSDLQWDGILSSWVDEHKLQYSHVAVVLSRDFYQSFDIEKPNVEESELMATLPFTIKDLVSESIFDLIVDYYDQPPIQNKEEQISVVCISKSRIIGIRDMLLKHAMQIKEITTEELALTRALGNSDEVNLLLSQHKDELVLTVVKQGQLFFSHRLRGFNELLLESLNNVDNSLVDDLSLELQRVLDYINSQLQLNAISHLYLAVICPDIILLAKKLSQYLAKNVVPFGEQDQYDFQNILAYSLLIEEAGE